MIRYFEMLHDTDFRFAAGTVIIADTKEGYDEPLESATMDIRNIGKQRLQQKDLTQDHIKKIDHMANEAKKLFAEELK